VSGNIFNSEGIPVAVVDGHEIFDLTGKKLYDPKGVNIYRLSGELIGHFSDARGSEKRLDRSSDKLFPQAEANAANSTVIEIIAKPSRAAIARLVFQFPDSAQGGIILSG
jgi:hypothetical protein